MNSRFRRIEGIISDLIGAVVLGNSSDGEKGEREATTTSEDEDDCISTCNSTCNGDCHQDVGGDLSEFEMSDEEVDPILQVPLAVTKTTSTLPEYSIPPKVLYALDPKRRLVDDLHLKLIAEEQMQEEEEEITRKSDSGCILSKVKLAFFRASKQEDLEQRYRELRANDIKEQKRFLAGLPDLLRGRLMPERYRERLTMLLYAEEHTQEQELAEQAVDRAEVWVDEGGSILKIRVPGVGEKEPAVEKGDTVRVKLDDNVSTGVRIGCIGHDIDDNSWMTLRVQEVDRDTLYFTTIDSQCLEKLVGPVNHRRGPRRSFRRLEFVLNRIPLQFQHRALSMLNATELQERLFPTTAPKEERIAPRLRELELFDASIGQNNEQLRAVYNMTYGTSHPRPYVLFGPPGTGKTATVVEAIKQVWRTNEGSRILVAAPSNTAADLLASRLLVDMPKEDILRLVSFRWLDQMTKKNKKNQDAGTNTSQGTATTSASDSGVDDPMTVPDVSEEELRQYEPAFMRMLARTKTKTTKLNFPDEIVRRENRERTSIPEGGTGFPDEYVEGFNFERVKVDVKAPLSDWEKIERIVGQAADYIGGYRIVVVTLCSAGKLVSGDIPRGFFTHLFIDEAGQATEPECLIPMTMLGSRGHLALAGDPHQLEAVIKSNLATKYGLGISLMERLMKDLPAYRATNADPRLLTMLVRNFRSHEALLAVPSRLFYGNKLLPCADQTALSRLSTAADWVPRRGYPLVFHGVVEKHDRLETSSGQSKSIFNPTEVEEAVRYVLRLRLCLDDTQIGVLSPYKLQVKKIKERLAEHLGKTHKVTVGSTEQFQGQEKEAMVLTTARSSITCAREGTGLGFLTNRKRFNVAVTRAKALLVVIGDPVLLVRNRFWKQLLSEAENRGGYTGAPFSVERPAAKYSRRPQRPHAAAAATLLSDFLAPKAALPWPTGPPPDAFARQRDMLREAITGAQEEFELDIDSSAAPDFKATPPVPDVAAAEAGVRQYEPAFMRMLAGTKVESGRHLNLPFDILRKKEENQVPEKVSKVPEKVSGFPDEYVKMGRW